MYLSYQFDDITDFERVALKERFTEELNQLHEIQAILEQSLDGLKFSKKIYTQRIKAKKMEDALKGKIEQLELGEKLKMLTLSLLDMKRLYRALKKRRVSSIDAGQITYKISLLEEKMEEEIFREECGLNEGFKCFPVSQFEIDLLLETVAI